MSEKQTKTCTAGTNQRRLQAAATRKRLFDSAYALLEKMPFEQITIRDIVSEAGVSAGTFYLYFHSKLDVYYETYVMADAYFDGVVTGMLGHGDTLTDLLTYFDQYAVYNCEYTSLRLTKLLYNASNPCFLRSADPGMRSVLDGILDEGRLRGDIRGDLTDDACTAFLMDGARGLVYRWCLSDGDFDLREAFRRQVPLLYRGISEK